MNTRVLYALILGLCIAVCPGCKKDNAAVSVREDFARWGGPGPGVSIEKMSETDRYIWCTIDLSRYLQELKANKDLEYHEIDAQNGPEKSKESAEIRKMDATTRAIYARYGLNDESYLVLQMKYASNTDVIQKIKMKMTEFNIRVQE